MDEQHKREMQPGWQERAVPAVVVGIPVMPRPPPAPPVAAAAQVLPILQAGNVAGSEAQFQAPAPAPAPEAVPAAADTQEGLLPASSGTGSAEPAGPEPQRQLSGALPCAPQDPLLLLIQQAEQLKASLEMTGGARSRLAALAAAATGPRLPNLLLPRPVSLPASSSPGGSGLMTVAGDGSLSAATAALVAAARALRLEADQLPLPAPASPVLPGPGAQPPHHAPASVAAEAAPTAARAAAPEAPLAAAPKAAVVCDCSDPESDAEDALLESLFFRQQPAGPESSVAARLGPAPEPNLPGCLSGDQAAEQAGHPRQQHPQLMLRVQLGSLDVGGAGWLTGLGNSVRCVVKALHKGGQAQQLTLPAGPGPTKACEVQLPLPAPAAEASQQRCSPALPPYLFIEFWQHSGSLIGVARVPLLLPRPLEAAPAAGAAEDAAASALPPVVVAEGRQTVCNILDPDGRGAGSIHVAAVLQVRRSRPHAPALHAHAPHACHAAMGPRVHALPMAAHGGAQMPPSSSPQDCRDPPHVPAVRHHFGVCIRGAHRLPSAAAYAAAGLQAPDGRSLCYTFPGKSPPAHGRCPPSGEHIPLLLVQAFVLCVLCGSGCVMAPALPRSAGEAEALETAEVACCSNPSFEASANHEMTLPAAHAILPLLQDGCATRPSAQSLCLRVTLHVYCAVWARMSRSNATCACALPALLPCRLLRFELLDCWADRRAQQLHGWAALPLCELASLAVDAQRSSSGSDGSSLPSARGASRTVLLPLCTEYDIEAEVAATPAPSAAAPGAAPARAPFLKVDLSYSAELCTMEAAEIAVEPAAAPAAVPPRSAAEQLTQVQQQEERQPQSCGNGPDDGSDGDSGDENSRQAANRRSADGGGRQQRQSALQSGEASRHPPGPAAAAAATSPEQPKVSEPFVAATVSVEIVRACGLAAAVQEAAASCGPASSGLAASLGRAAAVGPHAFARLALFADGEPAHTGGPVRTPRLQQRCCIYHPCTGLELSPTCCLRPVLQSRACRRRRRRCRRRLWRSRLRPPGTRPTATR